MTIELRKHILATYNWNWAEAMLEEEKQLQINSFIELNSDFCEEYKVDYISAYWGCCKFNKYELDGEIRIFCWNGTCFVPWREEYARGDWQKWQKKATLVEEFR